MTKWLLRLALLPPVLVLYALEWLVTYIVHSSGMLCRFLSGTIFLLVVIGLLTGLGNEEQLVKMFLVGFTAFLLPQICGVMASGIRLMCSALRNNIHP